MRRLPSYSTGAEKGSTRGSKRASAHSASRTRKKMRKRISGTGDAELVARIKIVVQIGGRGGLRLAAIDHDRHGRQIWFEQRLDVDACATVVVLNGWLVNAATDLLRVEAYRLIAAQHDMPEAEHVREDVYECVVHA